MAPLILSYYWDSLIHDYLFYSLCPQPTLSGNFLLKLWLAIEVIDQLGQKRIQLCYIIITRRMQYFPLIEILQGVKKRMIDRRVVEKSSLKK